MKRPHRPPEALAFGHAVRSWVTLVALIPSIACHEGAASVPLGGGSGALAGPAGSSGGESEGDDGPGPPGATGRAPGTTGNGEGSGAGTDGGDENPDPAGTGPGTLPPSDDAELLVELVNDYRQAEGLPPIPRSDALMLVAMTHAEDLANEAPQAAAGCNLHSWSNAGPWTPCCYTPDHAHAQCMWDKPRELTSYSGNGFEIAAGGGGGLSPAAALSLWQGSAAHDAVILNQGTWASHPWQAVGAGVFSGYAVVWFGELP